MQWAQRVVTLTPRRRGCYLVTDELVRAATDDLARVEVGLAHFFIQHTSASLTLNENADPSVRADMTDALRRVAPAAGGAVAYRHDTEGADDMAAHVAATLVGAALTVPVRAGRLLLGTWQGLWLCEHRDTDGGARRVVVTVFGQARAAPAGAGAASAAASSAPPPLT
jgi:secondary thiamine-phosphate synthase enzyme